MRMECFFYYFNINSSSKLLSGCAIKIETQDLQGNIWRNVRKDVERELKTPTIYIDSGPSFNSKIKNVIFTPEMGKIVGQIV